MGFNVSYLANRKIGTEDVGENANGIDIQGIDEQKLNERGERLPIVAKERNVEVTHVVADEVENDSKKYARIPQDTIRKYKEFDFVVSNDTDFDLRVSVNAANENSNALVQTVDEDGAVIGSSTSTTHIHYTIPAGARGIVLSDLIAQNGEGKKAMRNKVYELAYAFEELRIEYRLMVSGSNDKRINIYLIGVPN